MKLLPTIALSLFSLNAAAAYKCIVDGKTVYSSSKCAQDAQQFSVDKDSDWTMKLKTRTSPQEDARLNAIGASPKSNEPEKELPPKATEPVKTTAGHQKRLNSTVTAETAARK
jgi:hypothetical protein